jgi:hypothetical protein
MGIGNTEEDVDTLIRVLFKIARKPEKSADKPDTSTKPDVLVLAKAEVKKQMKEFVKTAAIRVYS